MTENFKIASKESVAFDLMDYIGSAERNEESLVAPIQDRKYWFTLYFQCYKAVNGRSPESSLGEN